MSDNEQIRALERRYNSMVQASLNDAKEINKLQAAIRRLENDNMRLTAELEAAKRNAQLLGDDFNFRGQSAAQEVERLRKLLKENNIPIGE